MKSENKLKGFRQLRYISDLKELTSSIKRRKSNRAFIRKKLAEYIENLPSREIDNVIAVATNNQIILSALNTSDMTSEVYIDKYEESILPTKLILKAFEKFYTSNIKEINEFYELKNELETNFVLGEVDRAKVILDKIENEFGRSIWAIDTRISIYSKPSFVEERKEFVEELNNNKDINHIAALINRKHQSTSLNTFYNQFLKNLLLEYRCASVHRYAEFLSTILIPDFVGDEINIIDLIIFSQRLTPIDRLILFSRISKRSLYIDNVTDNLKLEIKEFVTNIAEISDNETWKNISIYYNNTLEPRISLLGEEAIKLYSKGFYSETIELSEKILKNKPTDLGILDISARSKIYENNNEILNAIDLKNSDNIQKTFEAFLTLIYSNEDYEITIDFFETLLFKYICFDFINSIKPHLYSAFPFKNKEKLKNSCIELFCSDYSISPKFIRILLDKDTSLETKDTLVDADELSKSRLLRTQIKNEIDKENSNPEQINNFLNELKNEDDILESEFWSLWYKSKLKCREFNEIIEVVSKLLIQNDKNQLFFPLENIINSIQENSDYYIGNIHSVILYYKYFRLISFESKNQMSEFFEDYLTSKNCNLPSELLLQWEKPSPSELYFLSDVCNTEIMSILVTINSFQELLFERFKLLQYLEKNNNELVHIYESEEYKIFEKLYIDTLSIEHTTNKIDININGIKKSKLIEYESYYSILSEFEENVPEDLLSLFQENIEDGLSRADNAILHFCGRIYEEILEDFIFSEDLGLVRYLSSEIRHGWLPNQIRSVLESHHLVTELGADQNYQKSEHWRKIYELNFTPQFYIKLDEVFSWFSAEVDKLISTANSWPQVTRDKNNRSVAFNFYYDIQTLIKFKNDTSSATSVDNFFDICSEFIWSKLDECFRIMKNLLNKELKSNFNSIFDELLVKINSLAPELTLIKTEINDARRKTIEAISIIEGWFCRPEINDIGKVDLIDVIKVAITNTKGIFSPRQISFEVDHVPFDIDIDRSKMLSLSRALATAFQNSLIHGRSFNGLDITVNFEQTSKYKTIMVCNYITDEHFDELKALNIEERVDSYQSDHEKELLTREGGTGLYKIFRFVKDFNINSEFKVSVIPNKFIQIINL